MKNFRVHSRYMGRWMKSVLFVFLPIVWGVIFTGCAVGGGPPGPPLLGPNPLMDTVRFLSPFLNLILILLIVGGGIYFFSTNRSLGRRTSKYSPKDIAKMRYANGEISREEYLRIVKDLETTECDEIQDDEENE